MTKQSVIWQLKHPDTPKPSYLLGTMHVKDKRAFQFVDKMQSLIEQSEAFAAEFDLDAANQHVLGDAMNLPEGQSLVQGLKARHYKRLKRIFEAQTGMPLETFNDSKPFLVLNILTESILSNHHAQALDMTLWNFAKANEKIMLGVETYEEQISIIHKIPLDYQFKSLVDSIKHFKPFRKLILKAAKDYEAADIKKLYKSSRKSLGAMRKILLYDRNEIMATRIGGIALEQSTCFAVGAAHLSGKKGLIRLLKKRGFDLRPIYTKL